MPIIGIIPNSTSLYYPSHNFTARPALDSPTRSQGVPLLGLDWAEHSSTSLPVVSIWQNRENSLKGDITLRIQIKSMGNCAGSKPKNQADPHAPELKKPQQAGPMAAPPPHYPKQAEQHHNHPQKTAHNNPFEKEERHSDDLNAVGSLQIESAKKDYSKIGRADPVKETTEHAQERLQHGLSALKEHSHAQDFTFQQSGEHEQTVAEENVDNFRNNHINLNFQLRAS